MNQFLFCGFDTLSCLNCVTNHSEILHTRSQEFMKGHKPFFIINIIYLGETTGHS